MAEEVKIGNCSAKPGSRAHGALEVPGALADGSSIEIPFIVINGRRGGSRLHIQVAQHGTEIQALEAIRRVILDLNEDILSGVLTFCLPNPLAFRERASVTIFDPRSGGMNRVWPGKPDGWATERMAHAIWVNMIEDKADYVIDFHTGQRNASVWVFYEAHGVSPGVPKEVAEKSEEMARLFGAEVLYVEVEAYGGGKTCRGICVDHGIPAIVPELGGAEYFDEEVVKLTERGLKNIMIHLGMIKGKIELPPEQFVLEWKGEGGASAIASRGGVFIPTVKLGDIVKAGSEVGFIYSPRTFETLERVKAPQDGYVFSIRENPVVNAGESLMTVPRILRKIENA